MTKLHLRIEAALARGSEDDDNACSITETGVKVSTATLKQYHIEYCRQLEKAAGDNFLPTDSILPLEQPVEVEKITKTKAKTKDKSSHSPWVQSNLKQSQDLSL